MSDAYCEITDCRNIKNCEKCVELNIAEHDKRVKADAIDEFYNLLSNKLFDIDDMCDILTEDMLDDAYEQLKEQENEKI